MKRFLCAGEGCGLFISQNFKLSYFFIFTFFLFFLSKELCLGQDNNRLTKGEYKIPNGGVIIGDSVPKWFWDLELKFVEHPHHIKTTKLNRYRGQLLVIDFWATWCKPCVESIDKWEALHKDFLNEVAIIALHSFDFPEKAKPFADKRKWTIPIAISNSDSLINRLFFTSYRFGQVWIKDDKLIAIPISKSVTKENIIKVILNKDHTIEMNDNLTYFDKRYHLQEGGLK